MSSIFDSIQEEVEQRQGIEGPWAGKFAAAVATVGADAEVVLDAFSPDVKFGPCKWQPRYHIPPTGGITGASDVASLKAAVAAALEAALILPAKGDPCLVVFDENETPWVACWSPA